MDDGENDAQFGKPRPLMWLHWYACMRTLFEAAQVNRAHDLLLEQEEEDQQWTQRYEGCGHHQIPLCAKI